MAKPAAAQMRGTLRELSELPDQRDPGFPFEARRILASTSNPEAVLRAVIGDGANDRALRFGALYILLVHLNHEEHGRDYVELVRAHEHEFGNEPYFNTFRAQQLEILGLLAAVVAFVASAASIAAQSAKAADGARLMCAMAGAVILVFTSFAYTNANPPWIRLVPPAVLGAALLLTATLTAG
jgi:hypothetical protein